MFFLFRQDCVESSILHLIVPNFCLWKGAGASIPEAESYDVEAVKGIFGDAFDQVGHRF